MGCIKAAVSFKESSSTSAEFVINPFYDWVNFPQFYAACFDIVAVLRSQVTKDCTCLTHNLESIHFSWRKHDWKLSKGCYAWVFQFLQLWHWESDIDKVSLCVAHHHSGLFTSAIAIKVHKCNSVLVGLNLVHRFIFKIIKRKIHKNSFQFYWAFYKLMLT